MVGNTVKILTGAIFIGAIAVSAQTPDSPYLYGIHWYGNTDGIAIGELTDVETMTGGKGIWVLDIALTDESTANPWDLVWTPGNKTVPGYRVGHAQKVVSGKGHSLIYRLQPGWGRNVPHSSDPYTLANYAGDCKSAASLLANWCHVWVIGNEVNLTDENYRWSGSGYTQTWTPTPADYAATYVACRDKIHEVTPNTIPANQVVLMQPPSPGVAAGVRFMDSNEFLLRQIEAVADKAKIDGFCLHAYAGGGDELREDFFDALREQLMVIDAAGLANRPVYIGEWNHVMPNPTEVANGARFLHTTLAALYAWNTSSGGQWPGQPNHNVVAATWFVYPAGFGWDDYSLQAKKTSGGTYDTDPWKAFQYACGFAYPRGLDGNGAIVPQSSVWWQDDFNGSTLDQTAPLPDWKAEPANGGNVALNGAGQLRLYGSTSYAIGSIRTAGYAYADFALEADIQFVNAARIANDEANFDLRWREGSRGYSLTFYSSNSTVRPGSVYLRRTNNWSETLASATVLGGISSGDAFRVFVRASGSTHEIKIVRIPSQTVVVNWTGPNAISDSGQKVGWIRMMTYNLREVQVDRVILAGPNWAGSGAQVGDWESFSQ